ncbi:MAG: GntR family transcriptional regulator [Gemmatimonadaceae bacterium]
MARPYAIGGAVDAERPDGTHETARRKQSMAAERRAEITDAVRRRIVSGLHLGTLAHGDRLPSTRELSAEYEVTPRTIMAAYRDLEREGLVELRPRSGIYVAATKASGGGMLTQLAGWVVDVLVQGLTRNVPPIEFPERVRRCLETLRLRAVCIADNRDQIHSLCTELRNDYGLETTGVELGQLAEPDDDGTQLALRRADVLVTIALHASEVQRRARELGKPWIVVSLRADLMSEVTRLLRRQPVYFVATDPRFGDALRRIFEPTGHAAKVRLVVLGRDDLATIPGDAPTYIMRSAREALGETSLAGRVIPTPRVFSTESARELLTFIVRANIAAMTSRAA